MLGCVECWDVLSVGVCASGKWRVHNLDGQRELRAVRGRTCLLLQTGTIQVILACIPCCPIEIPHHFASSVEPLNILQVGQMAGSDFSYRGLPIVGQVVREGAHMFSLFGGVPGTCI